VSSLLRQGSRRFLAWGLAGSASCSSRGHPGREPTTSGLVIEAVIQASRAGSPPVRYLECNEPGTRLYLVTQTGTQTPVVGLVPGRLPDLLRAPGVDSRAFLLNALTAAPPALIDQYLRPAPTMHLGIIPQRLRVRHLSLQAAQATFQAPRGVWRRINDAILGEARLMLVGTPAISRDSTQAIIDVVCSTHWWGRGYTVLLARRNGWQVIEAVLTNDWIT
jgi:hypothetical protein